MDASHTNTVGRDVALDIMGQQPLLRIYTQLSFCFARHDAVSDEAILETLTKGLERLSASFPWVAGQVVNEGASEGNSGLFKIKAFGKIPRLVVKDLRADPAAPTMEGLRQASFPMSMLDEDVIAPRRTLPGGPGYSPTDPEPVLLLQLNFIKGGVILTVNAQHSAMDMTGQAEVIRLLSKACHGEEFTPEELVTGNLARDTILQFLDDSYRPGPELEDQIVKPAPPPANPSQPPATPPKATWAYFEFSPESVAALKSTASKSINPGVRFISSDDALTAFIWQACCRARLPRLSPSTKSTFCRAVDVRPQMGVSKSYPGLLQNMTYHKSTLQQVVDEPLGVLASQLRSELDPARLRYRTQALVTFISRAPDKSIFSFAATVNPSTDFQLSSWANVDAYANDFNLGLGKPESVRRPRFTPFEALMYLMPKGRDGEISAAISLRDEDLERLKEDEEFKKYTRYIG